MHTVRRPIAALFVAVLAACTTAPAHDLAHDLAGVPAAGAMRGVRLGMSEAELRKLRPDAADDRGALRETVNGYSMVYVVDRAAPERPVTVIEASREFATEDSLAAAWYAAFDAGRARIGPFASCDTMRLSSGARSWSPLRVAMWHTGPIYLSAVGHAGRSDGGTEVASTRSGRRARGNSLDVTVARNALLDQSVTALMETFAPTADRSCRSTSLDGAPRAARGTVIVSSGGAVLRSTL